MGDEMTGVAKLIDRIWPRVLYWKYDDAGSPSWEKDDCTVIAWAIANEVPYREAWLTMAALGRPPRKGFFGYGNEAIGLTNGRRYGRPLKSIMRTVREGNWIILFWGHACAMKNGIVYDVVKPSPERIVEGYWRVK